MRKFRTIDVFTIPLFFVAPAAAILRTIALLTSFDTVTMHFENKTAIVISSIIMVISIAAFLSYFIFGEKECDLIARNDNAASYIPAGIVSTALLFMGANIFYLNSLIGTTYYSTTRIIGLVAGLLAILSVVSFFLSIFIEKRNNMFKAAFSLSIVAFLAVYAMLLYFNKDIHPTNSPNRLVDQLAYLLSAIFFLFEARIPLGREKWRGYVAFGLSAALMCAHSSIPALIMYFVRGYVISESLIESILTLTLMIFIGSKVLQIKNLTPDAECEEAKSIVALASMRADEIEAQRTISHVQEDITEENDDTEDASNYSFDIPIPEAKTEFNVEDLR